MAKTTLYDLSAEIAAIEDALVESEGEITDDVAARLDALDMTFEAKVESIVQLYRNFIGLGLAAEAEEERLARLRQSRQNAAKKLKGYLHHCLERAGRPRVEGPGFKVRLQTSSTPSVTKLPPVGSLPERFLKPLPTDREIDRRALVEAYKAGEPLPEGVEIEKGKHVQIQ